MATVKNLTNSPYDLQGRDGMIRLPAFGEAQGEFNDDYLQLLEASMAVSIVPDEARTVETPETPKMAGPPPEKAKPAKGKKEADPQLTKLRKDYGKKPFGGWSAVQIQEKIDAKLAE